MSETQTVKEPMDGRTLREWMVIVVTLGAPVVSLIFGYAGTGFRIAFVEKRVDTLEETTVSRNEFQFVKERLERIDDKMDQLILYMAPDRGGRDDR